MGTRGENDCRRRPDALASWVSSVPAYSLVYPDMEIGVAMARERFEFAVCTQTGRSWLPVREVQVWIPPET